MAIKVEDVQLFLDDLVKGANGKANVEQEAPGRPINGFIVHKDFTGQSIVERQKNLWVQLREKFGADAQQIGMIFTYSPYEYEEIFAEESA